MPYKFTFMFILQNLGRLSGKNTQYSRKKRKYYRHRLKQNQLFLNPAYFIEAISDSFTQIPITYLRGKEEFFWGEGGRILANSLHTKNHSKFIKLYRPWP